MADNAIPQTSVDALVARSLPAWLREAHPDLLATFHRALELEQASAEAVKARLKTLPGLEAFARPLLQAALRADGLADVNVDTARVVIHDKVPLPSAAPRLQIPMRTLYSAQSLLAAALHNFHESETFPGLHRRASLRAADGTVLALSFEAFARLCRKLDLGGQYQSLLRACLSPKARPPAPADFAQLAVQRMFEERLRAALDVAVRMARLKGHLTENDYLRLLPLIAVKPIVPAVSGALQAFELFVLGKCVEGCMVIELRSATQGPVEGLISWFPGDPVQPLRRHATWAAVYEGIGQRLRERSYTHYVAGLITQREVPSFLAQLAQLKKAASGSAALDVEGRHFAIEGPVFACLRKRLFDRMIDDARVLAVPTDDLTQLERHERLEALKGAGLDTLTLAALFVPGLGELLFVPLAVDVMREVYDGYEAWRVGDRQQALAHAFNVAQVAATGALLGAGQAALGEVLERVELVDGLTPVMDGGNRLRLKRMSESAHYLEHPAALMRSFGAELEQVSDLDAEALIQITGLAPDDLRSLSLHAEPAPARLRVARARQQLHDQQPTQDLLAVERALAAAVDEPDAGALVLSRTFPGLPAPVAQEIAACATGEQFAALTGGKVPLALAERARWALREGRIDRALMGFEHKNAVNPDTLRLAFVLIDQAAPWPAAVRVEVRLGEAQGQLVALRGPAGAARTDVIVQTPGGYRLQAGAATGGDQGLLECLLLTLDDSQKAAFGGPDVTARDLGRSLLNQAAANRSKVARALGMTPLGGRFNAPRRHHDGRVGYSLSGRAQGSRQALRRGMHRIYPTLTEGQMDVYLAQMVGRNVNLWDHLSDLEGQLARLRQALGTWEDQRSGLVDGRRRRRVSTQIRRAWRRKTIDEERDEYVLRIEGERVGNLPSLPADIEFSHVRQLTLRNLGLTHLDDDFLKRFPQLQELDLRENLLTRLPAGLDSLGELRTLRLDHNQIVLDPDADSVLARLTFLEQISLGNNPLGRVPDLSGLRHLRAISLRNAGLRHLPASYHMPWRGLVDIRDNQLREVNEQLQALGSRIQQLSLHDNPLEPVGGQRLAAESQGASARRARAHASRDAALRDRWIGSATPEIRRRYELTWDALHEDLDSADFFRFLADFADSDDFGDQPEYYRARMWRILELCVENMDVREAVYLHAQGPQTCEDRLLLLLSQLEVRAHIAIRTAGSNARETEAELLHLGRSLYRLDEVDSIAARHIEQMRRDPYAMVDDIEVYLAYRVNLANRLGLPAQPGYMNYPEFSHVSSRQIRLAEDRVLAGESRDALSASLGQREFWQAYVRTHYRERFEALAAPFHARLEAAERAAVDTGEQGYLEQATALMSELNAQEHALYVELASLGYDRL